MASSCTLDPALGAVLRLSNYLDCEGRVLGENGFQAVVGGRGWAGLLSAVVTIFIALIGYRIMLGRLPSIADGVGWAVRLGIVVTFVTGSAAFQAAIYHASVDTPGELTSAILPAAGLSADDLGARLQDAYDRLRLGAFGNGPLAAAAPQAASQTPVFNAVLGQQSAIPEKVGALPKPLTFGVFPLPQTAMLFAMSTAGVSGGLHIAAGVLLAVAPLAFLSLLFEATSGLFSGWARALVGVSLGLIASTVAAAITLAAIDAEAAHVDAGRLAHATLAEIDPGALTVTVAISFILTLLTLFAAMRMAGALRISLPLPILAEAVGRHETFTTAEPSNAVTSVGTRPAAQTIGPSRATAIAHSLDASIRRESGYAVSPGSSAAASSRAAVISEAGARERFAPAGSTPLGVAGRRGVGRRTNSAIRRDRAR